MRQIIHIPHLGTLAVSEETALTIRHGNDRWLWRSIWWSLRLLAWAAGAALVAKATERPAFAVGAFCGVAVVAVIGKRAGWL